MSLIISSFLFTGLLCMLNIYHHHHIISNFIWFAKFLRVTWKDFPLYILGLCSFIATVVLHSGVTSRVFSPRSYFPAFRRDFQLDCVCAELRNEDRHTTLYASWNSESQPHSTGRKSLCPWRAVGCNPISWLHFCRHDFASTLRVSVYKYFSTCTSARWEILTLFRFHQIF